MINTNEFKKWLEKNTHYSETVIKDIVSRMKRADKFLEWNADEVYQYRLEQLSEYQSLSVSVKSQIKKSVKLYFEFWKSEFEKVE